MATVDRENVDGAIARLVRGRGSGRRLGTAKKNRQRPRRPTLAATPPFSSPVSVHFSSGDEEIMSELLDCATDNAGAKRKHPSASFWPSPVSAGAAGRAPAGQKLLEIARELWQPDYSHAMAREKAQYEGSGQMAAARTLLGLAPSSTYVVQHRGTGQARAARAAKDDAMLLRWCAEGVHRQNQSVIPFSMASRSAAAVGHGASSASWDWPDAITSRRTAITIVNKMVECRPPCGFVEDWRVTLGMFDQVYRVKNCGAKKNRSTACERIDGTGAAQTQRTLKSTLRSWESQTYVNCIRAPVPASLVDLTQADLDALTKHGPFTGAWDMAIPMLAVPTVCCRSSP
jgi:hypothetical protein